MLAGSDVLLSLQKGKQNSKEINTSRKFNKTTSSLLLNPKDCAKCDRLIFNFKYVLENIIYRVSILLLV